ncbi:AsmA-like C-terminal region [Mariprofundus ferrinatatus]|uniref:AsmA-like C-terminal region n=1 Tax=Mariprofundus ferrinatatus TaxID=1921087 RepID=A0A2K8LA75_9PROT|nr:translocation/assembly module TamB domain-containing protein [Mariprofundus ferrinatatus]ATX82801.1 AsmA-like C-terminal region [Mariprofundus ferrinatatus]
MRRWFMVALAAALALLLFTSTGLWFWLGSDAGRQWVASEVALFSDGNIEIRGLLGHPLSHLSADTVVVKSASMQTVASTVTLEWSPWRLLAGDLSVALLRVEKIDLQKQERAAGEDDGAAGLPPITLRLNRMRIAEVAIGQNGSSEVRARDIQVDRLRLSGSLSGSLQASLNEGELAANLSGSPGRWQARGSLQSKASGSASVELTGKRLQSGMVKLKAETNSASGEIEASWRRSKQELKGDGKLHISSDRGTVDGIWSLTAPQSFERGHLDMHSSLAAESLLSRQMELDITADWSVNGLLATAEERKHGLRVDLNYAGEQLQGLMTLTGWDSPLKNAAGQLSGQVNGSWQAGSGSWQLKGHIDEGRLAGLVARMRLDGEGDAQNWRLAGADIQALGVNLRLSGQGDADRFALQGRLEGSDISPALKLAGLREGGGSLHGQFTLQGGYAQPKLAMHAVATKLQLETVAIESAKLTADHLSGVASYHLSTSAVSLSGRQEMESLKVDARHENDDVVFSWVSQGRLQSSATFSGKVSGPAKISGVISSLRISYSGSQLLLADRLPFSIDGDRVQLERSALQLMGGKGSALFAMTADKVSGQLDAKGMTLSGNEPWMSAMPLRFAGTADLTLSLSGLPGAPTAALRLASQALKLSHPIYAGEDGRALLLSDASANLDCSKSRLVWQVRAKAPAEGTLAGSGSSALLFTLRPWQFTFPEGEAGSGALSLRLERLSHIQPLVPRIDPIEGRSDIDLKWSTPFGVSSLRGGGSITLDAIGVPEFGLEMQGGVKASIAKGVPVIDLRLQGGDGEMVIKGEVDIENRTMPEIRFRRFPLMQLPDQQLVVNGTISASEKQKVSLISGDLEVIHMRLEIPDPVPGVTEDLIWEAASDSKADRKKAPLSKIDVELNLSGDSEIYGRGMSLKPKGTLHLGGSLSQPRLTGVLEISSGKIEFRSVKLDILAGSRVVFSGDPKRPVIQIRAARKTGDITAGVIVEGPADQINTRLYSEPAMSNAEIFSYIATGRPLASLGTDSAGDMMTAAEFILGPGTMMQEVQGQVQQVTGLDIFELGGDASGGQIRAGRKLSDDITLTVEQIVAKEPSTAVTLEFMLTQSVSIFARQAMDLAPKMGLRYSKEWFGSMKPEPQEKQ